MTKKKKTKDYLLDHWVAVHPELTTDPLRRQGAVGKVESVSETRPDTVTVRFADGQVGQYQIDGLLTLYPKAVILQGLQSNKLDGVGHALVGLVYRLCEQKKEEEALKLAITHEDGRFFCLTDCKNWLDMKMELRNNQIKAQRRK